LSTFAERGPEVARLMRELEIDIAID